MEAPRYQPIKKEDMAQVPLPDGKSEARIIAGELFGAKGPARTWSPIIAAMVKLAAGGEARFDLPASYNSAMLVVEGAANVNSSDALTDHLVVFRNDGEEVSVTSSEGATLLVLSGEPLNEPIAAYGPFLMNTVEELQQAFKDVAAGKFGVLED